MSSGSSGRYQSKLFNFIHQQSWRLTQKWEHTYRHVQVATKWSIEILLYPVYLLLQSSQSATKKLHVAEPQSRLQLEPETPPPADTPIQQVLDAIKNLPSVESTETVSTTSSKFNPLLFVRSLWQKFSHNQLQINSNETQSLTIQDESAGNINPLQPENSLKLNNLLVVGIATNLANRHLVLVTTDNAILDILTPQQQAQLEAKIIAEIANYWRAWRLLQVKQETATLLPEIDQLLAKLTGTNPNHMTALPPAITTEIESKSNDLLKSELKTENLLAFLDTVAAKLESNTLVPVQQRSQEIIQVVQTQFKIFLYGKEQLIARGEIAANTDALENQSLNIPELIAAALNYFFGVKNNKNLESKDSEDNTPKKPLPKRNTKALSTSSQLQDEDLDPWLTWSDLFGEPKTPVQKSDTPIDKKSPALISSSLTAHSLSNRLAGSYNKFSPTSQSDSRLVQQKKSNRNLTLKKSKISQKVTAAQETTSTVLQLGNQNDSVEISQQQHQSVEMEAQPDWIEVKSTHIGYEKHPLEQILEWLDSAMLWLEEIFVKMFQFFRQLWRGK